MHRPEQEGYKKPEGYDGDLRKRLLQIAAKDGKPEGYLMPSGYRDQLRADILSQTVGVQRRSRLIPMRWAAVAAICLPLLIATIVWRSGSVGSATTQSLADVSDAELYDYVADNAADIAIEDLLEHELIDEDLLESIPYSATSDLETYLQDNADDIDLDLLDEYL